MAISPRLEQSMKHMQTMILSPQMQQAIQILQMPLMELRAKISQEMESNPLLEEVTDVNQELDVNLSSIDSKLSSDNDNADDKDMDFKDEFERLSNLDDEWRDYFKQTNTVQKFSSQDEEKRRYMESSISLSESLHEHINQQLHLLNLDKKSFKIGEYIIGSIDNNGYLTITVEQIAFALNCTEEEVEKVLAKIQKFSPSGVGARDLKECLFIQLNNTGCDDFLIRDIIESHLDNLAKHKFPLIAKSLKVSIQEVQKAHEFISSLEPKPGRIFGNQNTSYITPDIFIEEKGEGFEVVLNDDRIPHLHISNLYRKIMNSNLSPQETINYIKNKVRSGMWLIKNIQQRQQTIHNIMNKIVEIQKRFFKEGVGFLEPLTMQDIATQLNIHESTVSRAVSKKYVQTPHGLFPVKYFFSSQMKTLDGQGTSSENIKQKIKNIIANENDKKPFRDQEIIKILNDEGIQLARRTVAKYRKELNIPPSNLRRMY